MGPHDDFIITSSRKPLDNLKTFHFVKASDNKLDETELGSNDALNTASWLNEKDFTKCEEKESNLKEKCGGGDEEDTGNLFKLSVLFVRGNPFDSLKHWRMRCSFLDASLQIGSLGRIREVDEEFLNISGMESSSKRGVRVIQVQPKGTETFQECGEDDGFEELQEFCTQEHCKCRFNDTSDFANHIEIEKRHYDSIESQNAVQDDTKYKSPTNKSITSLAEAVQLPDEQKTFLMNSCSGLDKNTMREITSDDFTDAAQDSGLVQNAQITTAVNEKPGFFAKMHRRIVALFRGTKIDVSPSRKPPTTIRNSAV